MNVLSPRESPHPASPASGGGEKSASGGRRKEQAGEEEKEAGEGPTKRPPTAPYLIAAAMLPPSTVSTAPVVLRARARSVKARATSAARTSRPSRLPRM